MHGISPYDNSLRARIGRWVAGTRIPKIPKRSKAEREFVQRASILILQSKATNAGHDFARRSPNAFEVMIEDTVGMAVRLHDRLQETGYIKK